MRNTRKFKVIAIVALIAMITMVIGMANVSDAYSVTGGLSSSDKLVADGNVSVTLSFSNIDADSGVMSVTVDKVTCDDVFEPVTKANFVGSNGWDVSYSATNKILTLTNDEHITSAGPVVTLNLKVKSGVTAKQASVTFEGIVASAGLSTGDIKVGTKTITINAAADAVPSETAPTEDTPATPATDTTPSTTNTTPATSTTPAKSTTAATTSTATSNTAKQTTAAKSGVSALPKTGVGMGIVISAVVVVIAGTVFYGLYRNLKKYNI